MPICVSCRVPHHTEDCDQHKPPHHGGIRAARGWCGGGAGTRVRGRRHPHGGSSCRGRR